MPREGSSLLMCADVLCDARDRFEHMDENGGFVRAGLPDLMKGGIQHAAMAGRRPDETHMPCFVGDNS
jgi:methylmalonyl-CoA mutase N-terminal domain/subunit